MFIDKLLSERLLLTVAIAILLALVFYICDLLIQ
jgi:hypothetical protein